MDEVTIIRLGQMVTACVCIIAGAAVAKAAVRNTSGQVWHLVAGVALAVVFVYAALILGTRGIYFNG